MKFQYLSKQIMLPSENHRRKLLDVLLSTVIISMLRTHDRPTLAMTSH